MWLGITPRTLTLLTQITAADILRALGPRGSALRSLTVDFAQARWDNSSRNTLPIDALHSMHRLEELRIESIAFCRHRDAARPQSSACLASFLPASVKALSVRMSRDCRNWCEIIDFAWQVAAGRFPALKYFRVYSQGVHHSEDIGAFYEELVTTLSITLQKVFESTDVDFMVVETHWKSDIFYDMYEYGGIFT